MKCPNCKNTIPISSKFCEFCGHEIKTKTNQEIKSVDIETESSSMKSAGFFNRRVGRKHICISYVLYFILMLFVSQSGENEAITFGVYIDAFIAVLFFLSLAYLILVTLWRLNDLNKSRWTILGLIIPIVSIIVLWELAFEKGKLHKALTEKAK